MKKINIIFAQSLNGVIGKDGGLPWHLPDDLKEFKEKTTGCVVVMGKNTWNSLPEKMQPLPNRLNIIASNSISFASDIVKKYGSIYSRIDSFKLSVRESIPQVLYSIDKYFKAVFDYTDNNTIWVIGGKTIYEVALPFVNELHITTVMINVEGDTLAPDINFDDFNLIYQSRIKYDSKTNIPYYTTIYKRKYELQ